MNTVRWTCEECGTVNVVVLQDSNLKVLTCRECGDEGKLSLVAPVVVLEDAVHHT